LKTACFTNTTANAYIVATSVKFRLPISTNHAACLGFPLLADQPPIAAAELVLLQNKWQSFLASLPILVASIQQRVFLTFSYPLGTQTM